MAYSERNVCHTVEPRVRFETLPCTVGHAIQPCYDDRSWVMYHRWSDHQGGYSGGACENCGKTIKEVRVRINPKTGEPVRKSSSSLARAIATMQADVPPIA